MIKKVLILAALLFAINCSAWTYDHNGSDWDDDTVTDSVCGSGKMQSPINFTATSDYSCTTSKMISYEFNNNDYSDLDILNPTSGDNDHTIQIGDIKVTTATITDNDDTDFDNMTLENVQFHIHAPSEHTFNGDTYDAEVHFVHTYTSGGNTYLAVIGIWFDQSVTAPTDPTEMFFDESRVDLSDMSATLDLNPKYFLEDIFGTESKFYTYSGSLTTPPCTEGVQWFVRTEPMHITSTQLGYITAQLSYSNGNFVGGAGNNRETKNDSNEGQDVDLIGYNCDDYKEPSNSIIKAFVYITMTLAMILAYI